MKNQEEKRIRKFGYKRLFLSNNSMWYVKLLKAKHMGFKNNLAENVIKLNKLSLKNIKS